MTAAVSLPKRRQLNNSFGLSQREIRCSEKINAIQLYFTSKHDEVYTIFKAIISQNPSLINNKSVFHYKIKQT